MNLSTGATARRAAVVTVGLAAAVVLGACAQESDPAGNVSRGAAQGNAIEIVTDDNEYQPKTISAAAGEEITIEVTNRDGNAHDFAIESLDINTGTIEPGEVATATFTVPDDPTEFRCTFHGDMKGTIEVE